MVAVVAVKRHFPKSGAFLGFTDRKHGPRIPVFVNSAIRRLAALKGRSLTLAWGGSWFWGWSELEQF